MHCLCARWKQVWVRTQVKDTRGGEGVQGENSLNCMAQPSLSLLLLREGGTEGFRHVAWYSAVPLATPRLAACLFVGCLERTINS